MPTSEARINAARQNALLSTGPRTVEGKQTSRQNAFKHGMTGDGVVVPVEDEAEVAQRAAEFTAELRPSNSLGLTLVRRAAGMAVRMERCAERELAAVADRVTQALADFEAPEGCDDAEVAQLRVETGRIAAFDPSKEACLRRRYEAAAERSFYRALKEFRLVEKQAQPTPQTAQPPASREPLGSFCPSEKEVAEFAARSARPVEKPRANPLRPTNSAPLVPIGSVSEVPFTIGRPR